MVAFFPVGLIFVAQFAGIYERDAGAEKKQRVDREERASGSRWLGVNAALLARI